jgi:isochorismate synthase
LIRRVEHQPATLATRSVLAQPPEAFLRQLLRAATEQNRPLAAWQLPHSQVRNLVVDLYGELHPQEPNLEEMGPGFVVAPFVNEQKSWFVRADYHWQWTSQAELAPGRFADSPAGLMHPGREAFADALTQAAGHLGPATYHLPLAQGPAGQPATTPQTAYEQAVAAGVAAIKAGQFQKAVLAKRKAVELPPSFDLATLFGQLCEAHPTAFVSLVSLPGVGTWVGASPEKLVTVDAQGIFRTVALAGTQAKGDLTDLDEALWRQKEIEEQALVSRYIINCFKKIRVREFEETGPHTVAAGNLIHLRTDFAVDTREVNFPQLGSVMLGLLHPTSAVCGMPKEATLEFILQHEGFDRQLYSGYLGPVNLGDETAVYVNLRCMQLLGTRALLYAGAGVTKGSLPEREWQETEIKCQTMLRALTKA